jgi:GTP cyclohydrolase IA
MADAEKGYADLQFAADDLVAYLSSLYKGWEGVKQFEGTPRRLAEMYSGFCWSPEKIKVELEKQFKTFENGYNEMLVEGPITVRTLCPHHLLPVDLQCWVGYVPNGRVLGLSKIARIAVIAGTRPIMQEQYSTELVDILMEKLKPKGAGVHILGRHGCMSSRGIQQNIPVITSSLKGCILTEPAARAEFYSMIDRTI